MKPQISIITITKNADEFIENCLESVASQQVSSRNFEHIVIDGGSIDKTIDKAKSFAHAKVYSIKDNNISEGFNNGLKYAKGDWILFLNSDDLLFDNNVIESIKPHLAGNFDIIYGKVHVIDRETNQFLYSWGDKNSWNRMIFKMAIPHQGTLVRRKYFETFGYFDESFSNAMDYELLTRNLKHVKVKFINSTISKMRTGGHSQTVSIWKSAYGELRAKNKNKIGSHFINYPWFAYYIIRHYSDQTLPHMPMVGKIYEKFTEKIRKTVNN